MFVALHRPPAAFVALRIQTRSAGTPGFCYGLPVRDDVVTLLRKNVLHKNGTILMKAPPRLSRHRRPASRRTSTDTELVFTQFNGMKGGLVCQEDLSAQPLRIGTEGMVEVESRVHDATMVATGKDF